MHVIIATRIAPNKVNKEFIKDHEIQVLMNTNRKLKSNYPKIGIGDNVPVPVIN